MKLQTKENIIKFVKRLISYPEMPIQIPIIEHHHKIIKIRTSTHLYKYDAEYNKDRFIASDLVKEIMVQRLIKTEKVKEPDGSASFISEMLVIDPNYIS